MHGIFIAAAITTPLAFLFWGGFVFTRVKGREKALLAVLMILQLPVSYLTFHYIRLPLDEFLRTFIDQGSTWYKVMTTVYAPITEELVKLWPLLIPFIYSRISKGAFAAKAGLALGIGFGLGEIWMLADLFSKLPQFAGYTWFQFSGFVGERILVVFLHGAFTAVAVYFMKNKKILFGIVLAMLAHYFLNLPIFLQAVGFFGDGKIIWAVFMNIWFIIYFFGAFTALTYFTFKNYRIGHYMFGKAKCPDCKAVYKRKLLGINMGPRRYERCPKCRKWNLTKEYKGVGV